MQSEKGQDSDEEMLLNLAIALARISAVGDENVQVGNYWCR